MRRSLVNDRYIEVLALTMASQAAFALGQSRAAGFVDRPTVGRHVRFRRAGVVAGEAR